MSVIRLLQHLLRLPHCCMQDIYCRGSVNSVAMKAVKIIYPNLLDVGCLAML